MMTDDSSKYSSDLDTYFDLEVNMDSYISQYVEENENINFFKDLVPNTISRLEMMVFSTKDLDALKDVDHFRLKNSQIIL